MYTKPRRLQHWQVISIYLMFYDIISINLAYLFVLWIRFDGTFSMIPKQYWVAYLKFAPFNTLLALFLFYYLRLYRSIWRFASFSELLRVTLATGISGAFHFIGITVVFHRMPISYYLFGIILQFFCTVGIRFSYRFILLERSRHIHDNHEEVTNVMVIGAGAAGQLVLRDVGKSRYLSARARCIIDDNPNKWGRYIEGVPVIGGRDRILHAVEQYNIKEILIAIPSASAKEKRDILDICKDTKCHLKILPGVYQLIRGDVALSKMKPVALEDLLGREPIRVQNDEIMNFLEGKVILVTGGGGSIGSELCRQIAANNPRQLIIFDIYENNAYDIEQELKRNYPNLNLQTLIGSVRDTKRINQVFETYRPDVVYHAAAHKHVPLMENNPQESIKNNVLGTYKTACAALAYGTRRFVLISTDKAVNPTNIMGASKRMCEMVIQSMDRYAAGDVSALPPRLSEHGLGDAADELPIKKDAFMLSKRHRTEFVAVRFGNVLGSNGSVIPLFKKQIEAGGPVTVTHPDIIRYFMTIPEAVSLVLQAGVYARGGEIFVLDMGEPVKIDTLARNLIKLSGYRPDEDIQVVYTGLRPGEKLFEEKLMAEEGLERTENSLIHIGKPIPFDVTKFWEQLIALSKISYENADGIEEMVRSIVSTYKPENGGR